MSELLHTICIERYVAAGIYSQNKSIKIFQPHQVLIPKLLYFKPSQFQVKSPYSEDTQMVHLSVSVCRRFVVFHNLTFVIRFVKIVQEVQKMAHFRSIPGSFICPVKSTDTRDLIIKSNPKDCW